MMTIYYLLGLIAVLITLKFLIEWVTEFRIRKQIEYRISREVAHEESATAEIGKPSIIIDKTGDKPCFRVGFVKKVDGNNIDIELPSIGKIVTAVKEGNNYVYR